MTVQDFSDGVRAATPSGADFRPPPFGPAFVREFIWLIELTVMYENHIALRHAENPRQIMPDRDNWLRFVVRLGNDAVEQRLRRGK